MFQINQYLYLMTFANNPAYRVVHESPTLLDINNNPLKWYWPKNLADGYHTSRHVAAGAQNIFSSVGATPELLRALVDKALEAINGKNIADAATWLNNIKYRCSYPVDEDAALRVAMILCFVEGEDPNKTEPHWTAWKVQHCKADPSAYSFFLPEGLISTPAYSNFLGEITQSSLNQRKEVLASLSPSPLTLPPLRS